ncbi:MULTISPECIES: sodium:proton antiporter [unclassified Oleiphilus]|nr:MULTISPECIES: sodium:proton antiporter [unclassified Oleiphilus]KZY64104.1 sodium:proton exchanger [Oleiphilus sp. HI0066]KZY69905.1 sodium:proton exchanger [Oleiphilus sp. HI0067]
MLEHSVITLASIGVVSLICQWVAWRLRQPAILFLLVAGIILGPWLGWLNPDGLLGDMLFPIISLAVAVILFEGSLTLKFSELGGHGKMVRNLLASGTVVTCFIATFAAYLALDIPLSLAMLFGSIVVVSGPTVIMPLLRSVRPSGRITNILKWEGIVIDPIGALLAVLVFEFIIASGDGGSAFLQTLGTFGATLVLGLTLGGASGYILGEALRSHWLPQFLLNTGTLTFMLGVYALSNFLVHESGLLTVTVMGIWLANMRGVPIDEILEFKESLSVLLISALFILLAARMELVALYDLGIAAVWIMLALIFLARPISVFVAAIGTDLSWQEKSFLSWIAPRGIVAAAVSSLFAFKLEEQGMVEAGVLVPLVFLVIVVTVALQSVTARPLAKALGVQEADDHGFLFLGANPLARDIAKAFSERGVKVILSDTSWENVRAARMASLPVYYGNAASEHAENNLDLTGIGQFLAISPYKQLNAHVVYHYLDHFGAKHVFAFNEAEQEQRASHQVSETFMQTNSLFQDGLSYAKLASLYAKGATVKLTQLSDEFSFEDYKRENDSRATLLFGISSDGCVYPIGGKESVEPQSGWAVVSLVQKKEDVA